MVPNKENFLLSRGALKARLLATALFWLHLIFSPDLSAEQVNLSDKVLDALGNPVVGASVKHQGVQYRNNGKFNLSVVKRARLVISGVGYATQMIKINTETSITVNLDAATKSLNEVAVADYGTQWKKDVSGAVVSVNENALREVLGLKYKERVQGPALER